MKLSDSEFQILHDFLQRETGIDVPEAKRYLFTTRLPELMQKENCRGFSELLVKLGARDPSVVRATVEAMTTHESGFFREPHHFEALFGTLLPSMLERKAMHSSRVPSVLRILSAGCSFGQEAYTLAIRANHWIESASGADACDVSIVGIDVSERALERAREGSYTDLELGPHLPKEHRERYFTRKGDYWQLSPSIRSQVSFQYANLSQPLDMLGRFDVIFCRNVIIYFSADLKVAVLERLRSALEPEGALFIGAAESLYGVGVEFALRTCGQSSYYEHPATKPEHQEDTTWKS